MLLEIKYVGTTEEPSNKTIHYRVTNDEPLHKMLHILNYAILIKLKLNRE